MQTFTAPLNTNYKLEVWGAASGYRLVNESIIYSEYGRGGYSYGNYSMNANQTIYISIGGKGEDGQFESRSRGGWNGGGDGDWDHQDDEAMAGGGGCTSIQKSLKENGQLKFYESVKSTDVLIVAGGGGSVIREGYGYGGGETGSFSKDHYNIIGTEQQATQSSGYAFGLGQSAINFYNNSDVGAGGGGWYGGYAIISMQREYYSSGGGGSGHIGTMLTNGATIAGDQTFPSPSGGTETGHSGDGYAIISWISPSL